MSNTRQRLPLGHRLAVNCLIILLTTTSISNWGAADDDNDNPYYVAPEIPTNGSQLWLVDGKINTCTSPWTPMVDCVIGAVTHPMEVTGFYSDLTCLTLRRIGWTDDDYMVTCMDWDAMMKDLLLDNGTCYIATAGIGLTVERGENGIHFSWANYRNELSILTHAAAPVYDTWGFLTPFTWELWVALISTGLGVGGLVWLAEWASTRREVKGSYFSEPTFDCITYAAWQSAGKIVQMTQNLDKVNTLAARVIVWAYGLLIMVVIATYTGSTAATLTSISLTTTIKGLSDLRGKTVGTWDGYKRIFSGTNTADYPFMPAYFPWNNKADEDVMLKALRSGLIVALIIDKPFAMNKASIDCDLHVVGSSFEPTDIGFAFPSRFPDTDIIERISLATKADEEEWLTKPLYQRYFNLPTNCTTEISGSISVRQMLGLWYIMGAAILFSLLCVGLAHLSWSTGTNRRLANQGRRIAHGSVRMSKRRPVPQHEDCLSRSCDCPDNCSEKLMRLSLNLSRSASRGSQLSSLDLAEGGAAGPSPSRSLRGMRSSGSDFWFKRKRCSVVPEDTRGPGESDALEMTFLESRDSSPSPPPKKPSAKYISFQPSGHSPTPRASDQSQLEVRVAGLHRLLQALQEEVDHITKAVAVLCGPPQRSMTMPPTMDVEANASLFSCRSENFQAPASSPV